MPTIPTRISELREKGFTFSQIAGLLSDEFDVKLTKDRVQKIDQRHNRKQPSVPNATDEARRYLQTTFKPLSKTVQERNVRRIVAVGDLHGKPHPGFFAPILSQNPSIIVIGGDIFDQSQFSNHGTSIDERTEEFDAEMHRMRAWFESLVERTEAEILVLRGNHDDRVWRNISELLPQHLRRFFNDPLDVLVAGLPRIQLIRNEVYAHRPEMTPQVLGHLRHLCVLGDALISHAYFGSAEDFYYKWAVKWHRYLGWPEPSVIVQHHTHAFNHSIREGGHLTLLDAGMVAEASVEHYKVQASAKWKPGTLGCVAFSQTKNGESWISDHRSVELIWPNNV